MEKKCPGMQKSLHDLRCQKQILQQCLRQKSWQIKVIAIGAEYSLFLSRFPLSRGLIGCGYFVEFFLLQVEAIIAEVRSWSSMAHAESHSGVLLTGFYPVPPVRFRSLDIFLHFDPQ